MPVAACTGGKVQKFDYVNVTHMNRQNLELCVEKCGVSREGIREFTVYIEDTPPEPNEVAVETGPVRGEKGKTKAKGKGKEKGKGKVMDKEKRKTKVVENDDIVILGVVGGGNDMNAEKGGLENDEINNETEAGGVDIFEENVEFLDNENDIGIVSGSNDAEVDNFENESIDMVASENYLDEHRQSDDEEKRPNFVAFNPDQMEGCEWKIHATKLKNEQTFQVNLYKDEHTCPQVFKVKNVKTSWLSERYLQDFKYNPKRCVKGWRVDIMNELRCHVSRDQVYRAKREALKKLEGSPEYQFTKLWDYAKELRKTNPGSTVILGINDENGQNRFEKFYVCFSASKQGFLGGCRLVICVDVCHLKGPHKGILLTAVGLDPNNNLYPIAYAVVQRESTDTWEWFLTMLKQDVCIQRDSEYTFISDKQKGLIQAFQSVFPNAAHRLQENREKKHPRSENRVTIPATNSGVNDQPSILPPIVEQHEPMQHDVEPEILTEPGLTPTPPCVQGPTMYEQLQMAKTNISFQPQVTLQPRLNIRAPPPMTGTSFMPSFSSRPTAPISKTIVKEHGRKWVDISKWPSQSSENHGQK
ncbi:UNVERIFIED_CONTAM: hypothetical protein Sindi_2699700 [Sesamum indicum]